MSAHASARCPKCGTLLKIPVAGEPEGKRIRCGSCQGVFVLRRRETPAPSPGAPDDSSVPGMAMGQETTAGVSSPVEAPPSPIWQFAVGDEVAARYRIVRRIARGGMGEVYEAEDHELGGTVALKTIRPEMAREQWSAERFRREIQLARQVTHPNVCRIFDVSYHAIPSHSIPTESSVEEDHERVVFLTMELLRGETLTERLAREGPMTPDEALPIVRQLASALDAAHAAGVIHRDFKSNNVMLVPGEQGVRAVITDFGLARGTGDSGVAATLALGGTTLGTPDYLAPEQVEGGEVTAAADVYAFGLVLYEMVTGQLPFSGDTVLAIAVRRVKEDPPSPRVHVPDLDPRWERTILACLERDPTTRVASAGEALRRLVPKPVATFATPAIGDEEGGEAVEGAAAVRDVGQRRKVLLLLLLVLLAVAVGGYRYQTWKQDRDDRVRQALGLPEGHSLAARRAVAVLGLRNLSADPEVGWLGTAIAEMLRTELRAAGDFRVISGDDIARMEAELELAADGDRQLAGQLPGENLERIRRASGADYVAGGAYTLVGEPPQRQVRLDLQLQDAVQEEILASVAETGNESELFDLVSRAGAKLRERLGAERLEGTSGLLEQLQRASLPSTPEAARLYSEGLEEIRRFEPLAAKERFERAAEIEPGHPLIHSALALAWSALGYEGRSREEAKRALELADGLPEEEKLSIEARYFETTGDLDRAIDTWRRLLALYPDNIEYGLRLAGSQIQAGRPRESLTTLAALRSLPPPAGEDPGIDLAEATAAAALGQAGRQLEAARSAAAKGEEQGSRLLVAQARLAECNALLRLSEPEAANAACEESRRIFAQRGDRAGQASALSLTASILYDQGDLAGARERFEQSLEVYRAVGNQGAVATSLNNLAVVVRNQGDLDSARRMYEESLALFRQTGNRDGEATALTNLAPLLVRRGGLSEARKRLEQALTIRRETGDRQGEASALDQLGVVLRRQGRLAEGRQHHREALRLGRELGSRRNEVVSLGHLGEAAVEEGDLDGARKRFEEALALGREIGVRSPQASALFGLAEADFEQGDLLAARRGHLEALALREELGEGDAAAESRAALARVLLEVGDASEAEELARTAVAAFATQGAEDRQAQALAVRAAALRQQGRTDEAREAIRRATELTEDSENLLARLAAALEAARIQAFDPDDEADEPETALAALDRTAAAAREAGLFGFELEARLARLEVLAPSRDPLETRFDVELLAADARAQGYERLARAAERLIESPAEES